MKCANCGVEWTVPATFTSKIDVCPFCGNSVQSEKHLFSSLDDVLAHILNRFGIEVMDDGIKLLSLFADLAPQLKREKVILRYFVECNGNAVFLSAVHEDHSEAQAKIKMVMDQMENELLVSQDAVQQVCRSFWLVIGGGEQDLFQSSDPPVIPTQKKHRPSPQTERYLTQDDRLIRLIDKKKKPSVAERDQLFSRGMELLNSPDSIDKAIKMIRYSAQHGDKQACILLGDCYVKGIGLKKDSDAAEACYRNAVAYGSCEAQYKLGVLSNNRKKYAQAREWLEKAANAGYGPAIDYLKKVAYYLY